jgi:hypothetical protein
MEDRSGPASAMVYLGVGTIDTRYVVLYLVLSVPKKRSEFHCAHFLIDGTVLNGNHLLNRLLVLTWSYGYLVIAVPLRELL